jgi:hypothetical protein
MYYGETKAFDEYPVQTSRFLRIIFDLDSQSEASLEGYLA